MQVFCRSLGLGHGVILGDRRPVLAADDAAPGIAVFSIPIQFAPTTVETIRRGGEERLKTRVRRPRCSSGKGLVSAVFLPGRVIGFVPLLPVPLLDAVGRAGSTLRRQGRQQRCERRRRRDRRAECRGTARRWLFSRSYPFAFGYAVWIWTPARAGCPCRAPVFPASAGSGIPQTYTVVITAVRVLRLHAASAIHAGHGGRRFHDPAEKAATFTSAKVTFA